ncbi:MAG: hypothetical protein R3B09_15965 [Nannocystaceae bacterium]
MPEATPENALESARAEARALSDQLRQARVDLVRLGIANQNRTLMYASAAGALGLVAGFVTGLYVRKR